MAQRRTIVFLGLCLLTFLAADPSGLRHYLPLWIIVPLWLLPLVLYIGFTHALLLMMAAGPEKLRAFRLPIFLVGLVGLIPTIWICETFVRVLTDGAYPYSGPSQYLFYFLALQGVETVFHRYFAPTVLAPENDGPASEEAPGEARVRSIIVAGETLPLDAVLYIEACEHHVRIAMENGEKRLRARLRDIVAQTAPEDGLQPHRSWWVSRRAARDIRRDAGRYLLDIVGDAVVPIARNRLPDVESWIENHIRDAL